MKKLISFILLLATTATYAQVGIGTPLPDASAQLDVVATDKGVLIPRLALTSSTDVATITLGNVESLMVYNTARVADLVPGYYYWNGLKWLRFSNADETTAAISTFVDNGDGTLTHTSGDGSSITFSVSTTAVGPPVGAGSPESVYINESTGDIYTWNTITNTWINQSRVFTGLDTTADGKKDTRFLTTLADGTTARNNADFAITDSGNIGLGTLKPDTKLHVVAAANPLKIEGLQQGSAQDMRLSIDANGIVKQVHANLAALRTKTSDYTAIATDQTILVDATNNSVTIKLPTPVLGKKIMLKKIDATANAMVIHGAGAKIDGLPKRISTMAYQRFILQSDGNNWFVMAE